MGNDERQRLVSGLEEATWEHKQWTPNSAARAARYAKRIVNRRERREGRELARGRDD